MAAPRSFATGIFRFALVTLLTFVLLAGTTLLIAYAMAWYYDETWSSPRCLSIGCVCGMIAWLFVAAFHLRRETQTMPFSHRDQFLIKAAAVLNELGYTLAARTPDVLSFRPSFQAYLFGGGIQIEAGEREAKLTGPKVSLEIFRRCFRLVNHIQRVHQYLHDHRKFTENVLKRVELQLRLDPDQLEAVRANIISLLEKEGAVVCELSLMVQSENGIREDLIEFQVREWLAQNGIDCDIHKDVVQFVEVVHPELESSALRQRHFLVGDFRISPLPPVLRDAGPLTQAARAHP